jgi:Concanavalin A-like lectin/glucanases superfamily/Domain of unknown function (DUF2341)/Putative Ig domain
LSDSKSFTIQVMEVNQAPVLAWIADQNAIVGQTLTFTAKGTDADVPANVLSYSLLNAPAGASINASTGVFTWTPALGQEKLHTFTVVVTDNGSPLRSGGRKVNVTVTGGPSGWWNRTWTKRRKLVFDRSSRPAALGNFPVLVVPDGSRIDYASTKAGGVDLRFIDADGSTVLAYEIERWTPGGQSYVWVKVPKLDAGSTTDFIWMYYGNPGASAGQSVAAVWNNNHRAVWHLGASAVVDATGRGHTGTDVGSVVGTGKIAGGRQFDGASAHVQVPNSVDFTFGATASFTLSAWVQVGTVPAALTGVVTKSRNAAPWYGLWIDATGRWLAGGPVDIRGNAAATGWSHVAIVQDGVAKTRRLYVNGALAASGAAQAASGGGALWIGGAASVSQYFGGVIDEVRVSSVARTATWVEAEYMSGSDAFVSFVAQ